jgi:hypothetical protein
MQAEDEDLEAMLGLGEAVATEATVPARDPNERLWSILAGSEGKYKKIDNLGYWLRCEMSRLDQMLGHDLQVTRYVIRDGKPQNVQISRMDYAKIAIEYYLQSHHLTWFMGREGFEPADMGIIIDRVAAYPSIKKVIEHVE